MHTTPLVVMGIPGIQELLPLLVIGLILFGGKKIPELMRGMGQGVKEFKKGLDEGMTEFEEGKKDGEKDSKDDIAVVTVEKGGSRV